jgi:septum formation protein
VIPLHDVDLVLASSSRYRHELLARIAPNFRAVIPAVDESPVDGEGAARTALRLAVLKAQAVAGQCPGAVVIGSDQTADIEGVACGKPGTITAARRQLAAASGKIASFNTAVCLVDARTTPARQFTATEITRVHFRRLAADTIARYVDREQPLDCAGAFKAEGLGIALFERIESSDPTALIGLPLIAVGRLLLAAGVEVI